jgi:hypothetical protein
MTYQFFLTTFDQAETADLDAMNYELAEIYAAMGQRPERQQTDLRVQAAALRNSGGDRQPAHRRGRPMPCRGKLQRRRYGRAQRRVVCVRPRQPVCDAGLPPDRRDRHRQADCCNTNAKAGKSGMASGRPERNYTIERSIPESACTLSFTKTTIPRRYVPWQEVAA